MSPWLASDLIRVDDGCCNSPDWVDVFCFVLVAPEVIFRRSERVQA